MRHLSLLARSGVLLAAIAAASPAADTITPTSSRSQQAVIDVLKQESSGKVASRSRALKGVLKSDPNSATARWQAGQVKHGIHWQNYQTVPEEMKRRRAVRKYRATRGRYPQTSQGQLRLADWCRDHHLPQRERAHLTVALQLSKNPNDPVLRKRLGWKFVNGAWVKQQVITTAKKTVAKIRRDRKAWMARVRRLVSKLKSRLQPIRQQATAELKSLSDPAAIPALESVLSSGSLEHAQLLVELLAGMKTHHAADALARVAVFSPWDAVRKSASRELRSRRIEAFAPELLASLRTSIDSRMGLYVSRQGVHLVHYAAGETQHKKQMFVGRSSTLINPINAARRAGRTSSARSSRSQRRDRLNRAASSTAVAATLQARNTQRAVTRRNDMIKAWNDRVCAVLADGTGVKLPPDPAKWWVWWQDYNQIQRYGEGKTPRRKEYQCYYYYETRIENVYVNVPATPRTSCLVAGTPVWTDRGFVPVEDVKVGDLVLAKNAATGELSYQPVLRTTVREEQPVMKVTTDKGTIRATGGHTFWVSGTGWLLLKFTKPGQRFHTATGTSVIKRLEKDGREKIFNLVVADVHTYFVGRQMVLSHDVTFAEPTDTVVPGLNILEVNSQPARIPHRRQSTP